jgi:zinc protease
MISRAALSVAAFATLLQGTALTATAQPASPHRRATPDTVSAPAIAVERYVLPNGLTVLLSPDRTAPIVAVTIWYHVGSKNEVHGRTGFAHLFEHMMFQGSEHAAKGDHIRTVEDAGGTMNGSTNNDRTNYYEVVPKNYLETVLWLESDRMGFLLPALGQDKLDNQRDVVKNERRLSVDNRPYGRASEVLTAAVFPASNPYSWPVIGSMADLSAASVDDVKQFFRSYYAPDNAVLSICGDIDVAQAKAFVERYFGSIPRGPDITRPTIAPASLPSERRLVLEDPKSTLPRLAIAWPSVGASSPDAAPLATLGRLLAQDRTSRLTKLLVYDRQLATQVTASGGSWENEGTFAITVSPRPGVSLTQIEDLMDTVLATLTAAPPSAAEVARTKTYAIVQTITGLEPVLSKAQEIARGQTYFGDPLHYEADLRETGAVTPEDVQRVARQYLTAGRVVLSMVPGGKPDMASKPAESSTNVTIAPEMAGHGGQHQ